MKKALTAILIVLLALFMIACDSNPNDEQTPPPEEKTFTPEWVKRGDYPGYVVIREKNPEELYGFVDATFTVDDDYILFTVTINGKELEFRADANNVNEKDVTVTTDSWKMEVTDLNFPDGAEGKTNATVVVKNDESGKPVMTIDFEATPYNNYIYSFEHEKPETEPTFAPDWAVNDKAYSGTIMMGESALNATLEVTEEAIAVEISNIPVVGFLNISSASPATVEPNDKGLETDGIWNLTIRNIPLDIMGKPSNDTVADLTVERGTAKQKLIVTIELTEGSFAEIASTLLDMDNIEFTVTE